MPRLLYIILLLSCLQGTLCGSDGLILHDDWDFHMQLARDHLRRTEPAPYSQPTPLSTTQVLDLHEEITPAKAFDCYKLYADELKDKSQEELNQLLVQCFNLPNHLQPLYRQKAIALLLSDAQPKGSGSSPLCDAILHNDISLARYVCTYSPESPNQLVHSIPLWFRCRSLEMAQLMVTNGATLDAKYRGSNVIHSLYTCRLYLDTPLVQFYCTRRPELLNEQNRDGETPLLRILTSPHVSIIPTAYMFINLGARTDILPTAGEYKGKTAAQILRDWIDRLTAIRDGRHTDKAQIFVALADYIEHPPKVHSTLYDLILDQWQDKLD